MATVRFPIPATNRLASLPVEALSHILAHLLTTAVASNDQLETKGTVTRFHSKQPPPLEIGAYLKRLVTFTPFPRDAILLAIVYLNRITHLPYTTEPNVHPTPILSVRPPRLPPRAPTSPRSPPLQQQHANTDAESEEPRHHDIDAARLSAPTSPIHAASPLPPSPTISSVDRPRATPFLNSYTLHRLLLTSLLIACKFSVDGTLSQTRAAKVGGVTPQELCKLEGEGLRLLGWSLMWSLDEIEGACREVERRGEAAGVIDPEQADRDAATPTMSNSHDALASSHPDAAATASDPEPFPPSPPLAGAAAFTLLPDDDLPTPSSRRNSNEPHHPSLSSPSSHPSSSSEASPSQPSSRCSSPSFLSFKAAGVAAFRHNLLPDVSESSSSNSRRRRSRRGSRAADDDQQSTPPSSPSQTSSVGEESGLDDDRKEGGPACSKRASMETVRRVEGLTLAG
ncbi:hypothetical protein JCM8115_004522 [Rhodotorula mucilaginosa]|uniref:Uncharacterized protein n=1 Tax=Rhodotorula mucilaginosa TaxID=5537 RepID=A0A9P6W3T7_RHOMI|nr:hypothetical protein C6P46_003733 [Rhodotorula mucilaginosa]